MEYNLNGKISLDDYIQFNKFHSRHGFIGKFQMIFYPVLFIFLTFNIFPNMDVLIELFKISVFDFVKIFIPLIVVLIILILFNIFVMPIIYKKHYNANKIMQQNQNIKINEQFISITTETGNTNLTKSDINKIKYDKDSVYIYIGLNIGNIIKKRFLENQNDFIDMVNFIKLNYGKK
jgi:hypothetical protein